MPAIPTRNKCYFSFQFNVIILRGRFRLGFHLLFYAGSTLRFLENPINGLAFFLGSFLSYQAENFFQSVNLTLSLSVMFIDSAFKFFWGFRLLNCLPELHRKCLPELSYLHRQCMQTRPIRCSRLVKRAYFSIWWIDWEYPFHTEWRSLSSRTDSRCFIKRQVFELAPVSIHFF